MSNTLKKLTVVILSMAMVVGVLPSTVANAKTLALGVSKIEAKSSYELTVGDSMDLNFYGATGYNSKTDAKSVVWKSTNEKVVSIDKTNGKIVALQAGIATISCSCKTASNKLSHSGSVKITVKAKAKATPTSTPQAKPTAAPQKEEFDVQFTRFLGGKAYFEVEFSDASTAEAYKDKVKVTKVRVAKNSKRIELFTISDVNVQDSKLVVSFVATEGSTYSVSVEGLGYVDRDVKVGAPVEAFVSCTDVIVPEKNTKDVLSKSGSTYSVKPSNIKCIVTDEAGVVLAEFDGSSVISSSGISAPKITYTNLKTNSKIYGNQVKITRAGDTVSLKGDFSCTYKGKKLTLTTNQITVGTIPYEEPTGLDFVYDIHVEEDDIDGEDIVYTGDNTFKADMVVGDKKRIVYVFKAVKADGTEGLYTGSNISSLVARTTEGKEIGTLSSTLFNMTFKLDPNVTHCVILDEKTGRITAIRSGSEYVYLYKDYKKSTESLAGYIEITVAEEPYLNRIEVDEDYLIGFYNATDEYRVPKVTVSFFDQHDEPLPYSRVRGFSFSTGNLNVVPKIVGNPKPDDTSVVVAFDLENAGSTNYYAKSVTLRFRNSKAKYITEVVYIESEGINTKGDTGYIVTANDVNITTKDLFDMMLNKLNATDKAKMLAEFGLPEDYEPKALADLNASGTTTIKVNKSYEGVPSLTTKGFVVLSDAYKVQRDRDRNSFYDIYDWLDYKRFTGDFENGIYLALYKNDAQIVSTEFVGDLASLSPRGSLNINFLNLLMGASTLGDFKYDGTYTVRSWEILDGYVEELVPVEFKVAFDLNEIESLEIARGIVNGKPGSKEIDYSNTGKDTIAHYLDMIVADFGAEYDRNLDGVSKKEWTSFDELKTISAVRFTQDDLIFGADNKTIYIRDALVIDEIPCVNSGVKRETLWEIKHAYVTPGWTDDKLSDFYTLISKNDGFYTVVLNGAK